MTRALILALWSHWRRKPGQFFSVMAGLALATALWSAVQAINDQARRSYDAAAAVLAPPEQTHVVPTAGHRLTLADYATLRRAGWQVTPVQETRTRIGETFATVLGVDLFGYPLLPTGLTEGTDAPGPVDLIQAPGVAFAHPETAQRIGLVATGLRIHSSEALPTGIVLADLAISRTLVAQPDDLNRLLLLENQPVDRPPLASIAPHLRTELSQAQAVNGTERLTESFHLNLTAFGLLSFTVGLFIVQSTIALAFEQRRPLVRNLRSMGVPRSTLTRALVLEVVVLALCAGAVGLVLGYMIAGALLPGVSATLRGLYGADVAGSLTLRPIWILSGLAMSVAGALIAALGAILRLHHIPILQTAASSGWAQSARAAAQWQAASGLILAAAGGMIALLFDGLLAGFAFVAGVLLGAALLLPFALNALLSLGQTFARTALSEWVWSDMRAQLSGLSVALMALLLAVATNVGVGTMVSSFRLTFTDWLDQRLAAEIYVTAQNDRQGAEVQNWLEENATAVLPIRSAQTTLFDQPARVFGIVDHETYRDNWPLLSAVPVVWDAVSEGRGILINEQMSRRQTLALGDTIDLTSDLSLPIVGIYSDYGNPHGQALIGLPTLLAHYPDVPNRQFGARLPRSDIPDTMAQLQDRFGLSETQVVDQAAIKALSLRVFENTFLITGALNLLTLGVASFAMFTALLTLWSMRLPFLAPVWAMGFTRAQLARMELLRSVCLAALTAILAVPLGLVLAWALLAIVNVEAFGWRLPMFLFPRDWVVLGLLSVGAAALAAALPAIRLARIPPATLVKVFAHER